jgi:hypothetical protein
MSCILYLKICCNLAMLSLIFHNESSPYLAHMANTIQLQPDGILLSVYEPIQTYETIHAVTQETQKLIETLRSEGKPVRILIDITEVKSQDIGARKAALEGIVALAFDKMAVYGATIFIKHVARFIIQVAGKTDAVKYFDTKEEAMTWLTS